MACVSVAILLNADVCRRAYGYSQKLYHQTGDDFTVFDTEHQKAGKYDPEMPTGTFLKPTDEDIGLEGDKQMELYTKIKNPLEFKDRADAVRFWKRNVDGYAEAVRKIDGINDEYREKSFLAQEDVQSYLKEWRKNNPTASRREIYKDSEYQRLADIEQDVLEEWENASNEASLEAKKLIDAYMSDSGYDGVVVEKDQGSRGRTVKTYVVFDSSQMKSTDAVTYDDNGNEIPLSARFDSSKKDIRYSLPENKNTAINDGEYKLIAYSSKQKENWSSSKSIVIYENDAQLRQFIRDALDGKNLSKKMYFGFVSKKLSERIEQDTGANVEGYNCTLRASEIKKILKDHGDPNKEALRGQREITEDDFLLIPDIIQNPDKISLSDKLFEGKPVVVFEKTINGRTTVSAYISNKHLDLTIQTMYSGKNKGNLAIAAGEQAPANTPEANAGTVPTNNISNSVENVNTKNSLPEKNLSLRELRARRDNGEISIEEYDTAVDELFEEKGKAEGTIKPGEIVEPPNKRVPTPKSVSDGTQVRQFMRTVLESGYATPEMEAYLKELILEGDYSYVPTSNKKYLASVSEYIRLKINE